MKTEKEIRKILGDATDERQKTKYGHVDTYLRGIRDACSWMLEE